MTSPFVTHAFIAGELDEPFYGRTDLDKYALGVARASNFYIDFRGGLKSRNAFQFLNYVETAPRAFEFFVGEDEPPIMVCVFPGRFLFWSDQAFLVDPALEITAVSANEITITDASTLSVGDLVYAGSFRYVCEITAKTSNTITLELLDGQTPDIPVSIGEDILPLYTVANTYVADDLPFLTGHFRLNRLVFCGRDLVPQTLTFANDEFTLADEQQAPVLTQPTGLAFTTYSTAAGGGGGITAATGNSVAIFIVTAVDSEGNESMPSRPLRADSLFNYSVAAGNGTLSWTAVPGAVSYRVYRSILTSNSNLNIGADIGYLGETPTPSFVDNNLIPNFTIGPPSSFYPFSPGAVLTIDITAPGSNYNPNTATISIADGTGFIGYPIVEPATPGGVVGSIIGVLIYSGGINYTTSSVVTFAGAGTGATGTISDVSPATNLNPRISTVFQQRRVFAGSTALPLTLFASQPGKEQNFSSGSPPVDSDAYTLSLDAAETIPIRHLLPMRSGLIIMHSRGVYRLFGPNDGAVTPNAFIIEPQAELGVGTPTPIVVNNDILFSSARGTSFHALAYTFYTNSFSPQEISVLAPHLFGIGKAPIRIVWAQEPDKLLWVLREDGALLCLTYMKEQETFAWTQHHTAGLVKEICRYQRPDRDSMMLFVERDGRVFLEELAPRITAPVAEYWGSDASVGYSLEEPVTEIENLWHLEGRTVAILADGDALVETPIEGGVLTLTQPASTLRIGLPFECLGISLPLADQQITVSGRLRRIAGSALRLFETRGLEIGTSLSNMFEMRDKGWEDWGDATALRSDNSIVWHKAKWERDAQVYFRQRYPLPATILGYVTETELER